ncbi:MAG: EAL domain-containing protein [Rhizobiaceae bacterium]|nr:EAL domain-containing protein [Rhizobiaceae bacterium]
MRLRHVLIILLLAAAQLPATGLGVWVRQHLMDADRSEIADRHLMLARNLAAGLERYHRDVVASVTLIADGTGAFDQTAGSRQMLANLGIVAICDIDIRTNAIRRSGGMEQGRCTELAKSDMRDAIASYVPGDQQTIITPLLPAPGGGMRLYAAHAHFGRIVLAEISNAHFLALAGGVRFGRAGHAVIVDGTGRVLSHPKKEWVAAAQDLSGIPVIADALARNEGVGQFHSPALNADVVAGYAFVADAGWAVMVPQPLAEIELRAFEAMKPVYVVLAVAFLAALMIALVAARHLARPLERVTAAARSAGRVSDLHEIPEETSPLMPTEPREIVSAFNGMVRTMRTSEQEMRRLAYSDGLTGLLNRAAFSILARDILARADAHGLLFYFDLDDFKTINDTRGHAVGDAVLRAIADGIRQSVAAHAGAPTLRNPMVEGSDPDEDAPILFARFGGDEFVLLLPGLGVEHAEAIGSALRKAAEARISLPDGPLHAAISIGAAAWPRPETEGPDTLDLALQRADAALYHAKARGKGRMCLYAPEKGVRSIHDIRAEIETAIARDEMVLHYQPKITARTGTVGSVEALVRWKHPQRGMISPADFIPAIEDSDVVIALGEWVMRAAARDMRAWREQGRPMSVAINIAARHYAKRGFAERMQALAQLSGVSPADFILEITEEAAMRPEEDAGEVIAALKRAGFRVALDDYGRGYSNLQRLAQIAVDAIKIDRSLVAQVNRHDRTREIIAATVQMAEALNCGVVAEGVESAEHAATLRRLGCHELQGYFFSRPLAARDLAFWLKARESSHILDLQDAIARGW